MADAEGILEARGSSEMPKIEVAGEGKYIKDRGIWIGESKTGCPD